MTSGGWKEVKQAMAMWIVRGLAVGSGDGRRLQRDHTAAEDQAAIDRYFAKQGVPPPGTNDVNSPAVAKVREAKLPTRTLVLPSPFMEERR